MSNCSHQHKKNFSWLPKTLIHDDHDRRLHREVKRIRNERTTVYQADERLEGILGLIS